MRDWASELRAIADGRLMLRVRNGVTVSRSMLAMIADEIDALRAAPLTPAEVGGHADAQTEARAIARYEVFADPSYYDLWAVRPVGEQSFNATIHAASHADAEAIATALAAKDAELAEAWQRYVDANEARIDAEAQLAEARKALEASASALDEAMEDVSHWGSYAGEYFQDKHDLDGDLDRIARQASAARRALAGGKVDG